MSETKVSTAGKKEKVAKKEDSSITPKGRSNSFSARRAVNAVLQSWRAETGDMTTPSKQLIESMYEMAAASKVRRI